MNCIKCGKEMGAFEMFCSGCGASKNITKIGEYAGLTNSSGILEFVRKIFKKICAIVLWIALVVITLSGAVSGWGIGYSINHYYAPRFLLGIIGVIFGLIIGALIGMLVIIVAGGLVATFLKIEEHLNNLVNKE